MIDLMEKDKTIEFRGEAFPAWHGSPFDRGSADSWYSRGQDPHYWPNGTYRGQRVEAEDMTLAEMRAYYAGYEYNEQFGGKKEWD
jgi:hypothetical protein